MDAHLLASFRQTRRVQRSAWRTRDHVYRRRVPLRGPVASGNPADASYQLKI